MKALKKLPEKELDGITLAFWHDISIHPSLIKLLNYCEQNHKDKYREGVPESVHPHIQQERNGGQKGWNRLQALLLNPPSPFAEDSVTENPTKKKYKQVEMFSPSHTE